MITGNHMPLRRVTVDVPSRPLLEAGFFPKTFFAHNESVEVLHVYAFQPRERVLLVRIVRSGRPLSESEIARRRESFRRRYRLRDFEILRTGEDGRTFVALLRQENPGILEQILEELGAGVTPITPTVLRKDVSTLSFVADDATEKEIFTLLDGLGVRWRLKGRQAVRLGRESGTDLTPRQRELLSLAWNLGYFDIPARADLRKIADLTGLSRNTVSQHLRRGMRRILREWVG